MIELAGLSLVLLSLCGLACSIWALVQNEKTSRERKTLLDAVSENRADFWPLMRQFEAVTYDQHFRCRCWMRNPMMLYGNRLRTAAALLQERSGPSKPRYRRSTGTAAVAPYPDREGER